MQSREEGLAAVGATAPDPDETHMNSGFPAARVHQVSASRGGVPKFPLAEAVVTPLGLEGDGHRDTRAHGGPRQAILLIAIEAIERLRTEGYPLYPGALGENITSAGLDHRSLRSGQRYRIGPEVLIELTKPRAPCRNLDVYGESLRGRIYDPAVKARDPLSPVWGVSGFYASVMEGGRIRPGDPILLMDARV
jgi:MOSC domain-containing protein YiiM